MSQALFLESQCKKRVVEHWPEFVARRSEWLRSAERFGRGPEKAAENIITDLFCEVLDWSRGDVNYQVGRSDFLLTHKGIKRLLVETKAPGHLTNRRTFEQALEQARRYAVEQWVQSIGVSDGNHLYVVDLRSGGHKDRISARLDSPEPPPNLWFVSVHGIYRDCPPAQAPSFSLLPSPEESPTEQAESDVGPVIIGRKVGREMRPAECFAFVADIAKPTTWKLPYLLASGEPDPKRLPMAISAVLRNYRGRSVEGIPEAAVPQVLFRLGRAAWHLGRFPDQLPSCPEVFRDLKEILLQLGLWEEIQMEEPLPWESMDRTPGT